MSNNEISALFLDKMGDSNSRKQICKSFSPTTSEVSQKSESNSELSTPFSEYSKTLNSNEEKEEFKIIGSQLFEYHLEEITTHFTDFKLKKPLNFENKLLLNRFYLHKDEVESYFNICIDHIINILNRDYGPGVVTTGVQLFIMFFEVYIHLNTSLLMSLGIIAIKISSQLEDDDSNYDSLREASIAFNVNFEELLRIEEKLVSKFKGFYFDNVYSRLTTRERIELINNKSIKNIYYKFIKNHSLYTNSSKKIAMMWQSFSK